MNIDKHIEEGLANMPEAPKGLSKHQVKLFDICKVYRIARPVLVFARKILFVKKKWVIAIDILMAALDTACPQE